MNRIQTLLLMAVLLLKSSPINSQNPKLDDVNALKERKMLVLLAEPDAKILETLEKKYPNLVNYYTGLIDTYNANLKTAVESFWTYQDEFKFVTETEAREIKKSKSKEYAIIYTTSVSYQGGATYFNLMLDDDLVKKELIDYHLYTINGYFAICVSLIEDYGGKVITSCQTNRYLPTKSEFACAISICNKTLARAEQPHENYSLKKALEVQKVSCSKLKEMTLIINKNELSKDMTVDRIKSIYPYKVEVLEDEDIDKLIYAKTPDIAYLYAFPIYSLNPTRKTIFTTLNLTGNDTESNCSLDPFDFIITDSESYENMATRFISEKVIKAFVSYIE